MEKGGFPAGSLAVLDQQQQQQQQPPHLTHLDDDDHPATDSTGQRSGSTNSTDSGGRVERKGSGTGSSSCGSARSRFRILESQLSTPQPGLVVKQQQHHRGAIDNATGGVGNTVTTTTTTTTVVPPLPLHASRSLARITERMAQDRELVNRIGMIVAEELDHTSDDNSSIASTSTVSEVGDREHHQTHLLDGGRGVSAHGEAHEATDKHRRVCSDASSFDHCSYASGTPVRGPARHHHHSHSKHDASCASQTTSATDLCSLSAEEDFDKMFSVPFQRVFHSPELGHGPVAGGGNPQPHHAPTAGGSRGSDHFAEHHFVHDSADGEDVSSVRTSVTPTSPVLEGLSPSTNQVNQQQQQQRRQRPDLPPLTLAPQATAAEDSAVTQQQPHGRKGGPILPSMLLGAGIGSTLQSAVHIGRQVGKAVGRLWSSVCDALGIDPQGQNQQLPRRLNKEDSTAAASDGEVDTASAGGAAVASDTRDSTVVSKRPRRRGSPKNNHDAVDQRFYMAAAMLINASLMWGLANKIQPSRLLKPVVERVQVLFFSAGYVGN